LFEGVPGLGYAARYERARSLWHAGQKEQARKQFRALYDKTLAEDVLPAIDADFRQALAGDGTGDDGWSALVRKAATRLIKDKHRRAVLALARQCWQLDDQPLADELLATALEGVKEEKERLPLRLAGLGFLWETGQLPEADRVLEKLLADPKLAERAALWRLRAK